MATTGIWKIEKRLDKVIDYVNRVIPKEEKKSNEILLNNLDTNLIASKYL